jgi:ABC-type branched-subunit amino acid transport system ATPase component
VPSARRCRRSCSICFLFLPQFLDGRGGDLSGGQQHLAIALTLAAGPRLPILHEPTSIWSWSVAI